MTTTSVCVIRPPKATLQVLSEGVATLARVTRIIFHRVHQKGGDEARLKENLCWKLGMRSRHFGGCRAEAFGIARAWKERLRFEQTNLQNRLAMLAATREKDWRKKSTRRRNAVQTRKAEARLARAEKELGQGVPRHCFGGRKLLRQGKLKEWRRRRDSNALFAGESGKIGGNEVARWDPDRRTLRLILPYSQQLKRAPVLLFEKLPFPLAVLDDLRKACKARTSIAWRVMLLPRGKVQLCVTYEQEEPPVYSAPRYGALAMDLNADHIALTRVSKEGRVLDARRIDLKKGNDSVQQAARTISAMAARHCIPVVAEDLDFRKKKSWLRGYGKKFAAVLSLFRSKQVLMAVERQCRRRGMELITVDPAWTTKIAKNNKYPDRYRLGMHHAAALVIGRRGLGFAERVEQPVKGPEEPPRRADVKRQGTLGWQCLLTQWLPSSWRKGGRPGVRSGPGAREGPVGESTDAPRPDGRGRAKGSRGAVHPANGGCVLTVA